MPSDYHESDLEILLPVYYNRLFPFNPYYKWLNYGNVDKKYFSQREFSFTLEGDIYLRYQSFNNQEELHKEILKLYPQKIDIGAVFSFRPREHRQVATFQPLEKELVFDIDMTDYDQVRHCCNGADICNDCWHLMKYAVKIINRTLKEDFGFCHLLWVYSGRRGVHCWVCDEKARQLSPDARSAIAEYLSVVKGGENQTKKVNLTSHVHPSIQEALKIIRPSFEDYALARQDILGTADKWKKVIALVGDEKVSARLETEMNKQKNSEDRWSALREILTEAHRKNEIKKGNIPEEIMLQYCYPRLDVNVTKGLNHLLKSPFCIHPKTGRVCVPFLAEEIDKFDPFAVPTISQLMEEIRVHDLSASAVEDDGTSKKRIKDYKKTSLKHSVAAFKKFLSGLESTWAKKRIEMSDKTGEF